MPYFLSLTAFQQIPLIAFIKLYGLRGISEGFSNIVSGLMGAINCKNPKAKIYGFLSVAMVLYTVIIFTYPQLFLNFGTNGEKDKFLMFLVATYGILSITGIANSLTLMEATEQKQLDSTYSKHMSITSSVSSLSLIGSALFVCRPWEKQATQLLTQNGWILTLAIFGTLIATSLHTLFVSDKT